MQTTTTYRSHWVDASGRRHARLGVFGHPRGRLTPVLNLDEVHAWLALATSDEMRRLGFPGGSDHDGCAVAMRRLLDAVSAGGADAVRDPDHAVSALCAELTDDVPRYHQQGDVDWRTPFVAMRERWPAPATLACEVKNLTPHVVVVGEVTLAPAGAIARAVEDSTPDEPIRISIPDPTGAPTDQVECRLPTSRVRYTGVRDLPSPEPGVYYVVSIVAAQAAISLGRWAGDLLVPGEQVRDTAGRIVGCRSLQRVA